MRSNWLATIALLVSLVGAVSACTNDALIGQSGDGGADGQAPADADGVMGMTSRAAFRARFCDGSTQRLCNGWLRCCVEIPYADEAQCAAESAATDCGAFVDSLAGLDDGRLQIDGSALSRVLDQRVFTPECEFDPGLATGHHVLHGDLPVGAACEGTSEDPSGLFACELGLVCRRGPAQPDGRVRGVCETPGALGEPCDRDAPWYDLLLTPVCESSLRCAPDETCQPLVPLGGECDQGSDCESSNCRYEDGRGACASIPPVSARCPRCALTTAPASTGTGCSVTFRGCPGSAATRYRIECVGSECRCERDGVVVGRFGAEISALCTTEVSRDDQVNAAREGCGFPLY